jgi:hypothetical protein
MLKIVPSTSGFAGFPPGFDPGSGQVGFVVDNVALGKAGFFSKYFSFPCQSLFHQVLHDHPLGLV